MPMRNKLLIGKKVDRLNLLLSKSPQSVILSSGIGVRVSKDTVIKGETISLPVIRRL